ncbi:HTH-type transcriptional activator RhaR [subsurface metagenome]
MVHTEILPNLHEIDKLYPQVTFTHLYKCSHDWKMTPRVHSDCHELFFILEGKGSFNICGENYQAKPQDIFLIKPEQSHSAIADAAFPYVYYSLHYRLPVEKSTANKSLEEELPLLERFYTKTYPYISKITVKYISDIREIIDKMEIELAHKKNGYQTILMTHMLQILTLIARASFQINIKGNNYGKHPINNRNMLLAESIKKYIIENLTEKIALMDIAEEVFLSPNFCCSIFKSVTGSTIFQYIEKLRIERGKTLLCRFHLNVSETAYELGYQNIYYFSHVFKKRTGISPKDYVTSPQVEEA